MIEERLRSRGYIAIKKYPPKKRDLMLKRFWLKEILKAKNLTHPNELKCQ